MAGADRRRFQVAVDGGDEGVGSERPGEVRASEGNGPDRYGRVAAFTIRIREK